MGWVDQKVLLPTVSKMKRVRILPDEKDADKSKEKVSEFYERSFVEIVTIENLPDICYINNTHNISSALA